jgi:hypothetical protein
MGANLLLCNAADRLQARTRRECICLHLAQFGRELEKVIRELTLRIVAHRLSEFDFVWEVARVYVPASPSSLERHHGGYSP